MNKVKESIGFVGLGNMGAAMATSLLKAGFSVRVYNRTVEKARPLMAQGATLARSPADAVERGGIVLTMLTDDRAVEAVTLGTNGVLERLGNGIHVSMSTIAPHTARRLAGLHRERGASYVASPVFGKPRGGGRGGRWGLAPRDPAAPAGGAARPRGGGAGVSSPRDPPRPPQC